MIMSSILNRGYHPATGGPPCILYMMKTEMIYSTRTEETKQAYMVDLEWSTEDRAIDRIWIYEQSRLTFIIMTYSYLYVQQDPTTTEMYSKFDQICICQERCVSAYMNMTSSNGCESSSTENIGFYKKNKNKIRAKEKQTRKPTTRKTNKKQQHQHNKKNWGCCMFLFLFFESKVH